MPRSARPLSRLCFEGPESELTLTENTQPAILTVSVAIARVLEARGWRPDFYAGHSLGEYSAHVAAGTFGFADAVRTVRNRGRYMQEAVPVGTGAMAAILGLDGDAVAAACAEAADGRGGLAGQPQRARPGGDCRDQGRRRARRGGRQGARRQACHPAGGERPVPLRADEAGRGSPGPRAARAGRPGAAPARRRQHRRRAEGRRRRRRRGPGAPGVRGGAVGGRGAPSCIRGRPHVC